MNHARLTSSALLLLSCLSFAAVSTSGDAFAQPPPDDPITEVARQRYLDGVKAFDAGKYEDARSAFLQAYSLKRHPAVLLNLGQSELRAGYPVDAGNHLTQFIRLHKEAKPNEIESARTGIEEAKKKAGHIIVIVDANGADVSVDGNLVGKSPLLDPVFVTPGQHAVLATFQGKSSTQTVDAKAGPATAANLALGVPGVAAGPAPVGPPAQPQPWQPQPQPQQPPPGQVGFQFGAQQPGDTTDREPFGSWYVKKPGMWVLTGAAGAGLIMGIAATAAHVSLTDTVESNVSDIKSEAENRGQNENGICLASHPDYAHFADACEKLDSNITGKDVSLGFAVTGWVLFGGGLIGGVIYTMVDWYPGKKSTAEGPPEIRVAPVVSDTFQGVGASGRF